MSAHRNTDGIVALSSRARDIRAFRSLIYKVLEDVGHLIGCVEVVPLVFTQLI